MARAVFLINTKERAELTELFYNYPIQRLHQLINEGKIDEHLLEYMPYLESQIHVAFIKALDGYNKGSERSKKRRPQYFKKFFDKVSKKHMEKTVINVNAAIARVEGTASRSPLKADKELYQHLLDIKEGIDPLSQKLEELNPVKK